MSEYQIDEVYKNHELISNIVYNLDDFGSYGSSVLLLDKELFEEYNKIDISDEVDDFFDFIKHGYLMRLSLKYLTQTKVDLSLINSARFLSGTYALHRGSYDISREDVVNGWLLTLKLFLMDMRPYVFKEY